MTSHEHRLSKLEILWRRPPSWKVWLSERTDGGELVEMKTGAAVQPGPDDVVIVFSTCPSGRSGGAQPPETS